MWFSYYLSHIYHHRQCMAWLLVPCQHRWSSPYANWGHPDPNDSAHQDLQGSIHQWARHAKPILAAFIVENLYISTRWKPGRGTWVWCLWGQSTCSSLVLYFLKFILWSFQQNMKINMDIARDIYFKCVKLQDEIPYTLVYIKKINM
jgi:hypothetical protein